MISTQERWSCFRPNRIRPMCRELACVQYAAMANRKRSSKWVVFQDDGNTTAESLGLLNDSREFYGVDVHGARLVVRLREHD